MSSYDEIAGWYDEWVSGPMSEDPYFREVLALMGEVAGQQICDLACGEGRVARHLAGMGARVVGIDLSVKLLEIARRQEGVEPRGIEYLQEDARSLDGVADGAFDGVVCNMALMDIADLVPTLQSVARVLRPGGWFVFSILHPCYNTARSGEMRLPQGAVRAVGGYFVEGYWRSDTRTGPPFLRDQAGWSAVPRHESLDCNQPSLWDWAGLASASQAFMPGLYSAVPPGHGWRCPWNGCRITATGCAL